MRVIVLRDLKSLGEKIEFMKYENRKSITKIQFYLVLI